MDECRRKADQQRPLAGARGQGLGQIMPSAERVEQASLPLLGQPRAGLIEGELDSDEVMRDVRGRLDQVADTRAEELDVLLRRAADDERVVLRNFASAQQLSPVLGAIEQMQETRGARARRCAAV